MHIIIKNNLFPANISYRPDVGPIWLSISARCWKKTSARYCFCNINRYRADVGLPIKNRYFADQKTTLSRSKYSIMPIKILHFADLIWLSINSICYKWPFGRKRVSFLIAIFDLIYKETIKCLWHLIWIFELIFAENLIPAKTQYIYFNW